MRATSSSALDELDEARMAAAALRGSSSPKCRVSPLAALVLPPLVPLEQLIAAAEAEAAAASSSGSGGGRSDGRGRDARGGGSSSLLDELQAALE